ncbi:MAG: hypothetical protein ACI8PB_004181 [Desulforhopalus sp.]|jgi:hypothetical protein
MNPMVIKYVGLTGIAYGIHVYLALAQVALCLFLVANGMILLSKKDELSVWPTRLGLRINERARKWSINGWLMILTGITLILPLFGLPYLLAVAACAASVIWMISLGSDTANLNRKKTGRVFRKVLTVSAVIILGFTLWEGRDLVRAGWDVTYKAAYWDKKEVQGWQKTNNPHAPKVGELAPDFELTDVNGTNTVRLADFRGNRPVVLLFGSFT